MTSSSAAPSISPNMRVAKLARPARIAEEDCPRPFDGAPSNH